MRRQAAVDSSYWDREESICKIDPLLANDVYREVFLPRTKSIIRRNFLAFFVPSFLLGMFTWGHDAWAVTAIRLSRRNSHEDKKPILGGWRSRKKRENLVPEASLSSWTNTGEHLLLDFFLKKKASPHFCKSQKVKFSFLALTLLISSLGVGNLLTWLTIQKVSKSKRQNVSLLLLSHNYQGLLSGSNWCYCFRCISRGNLCIFKQIHHIDSFFFPQTVAHSLCILPLAFFIYQNSVAIIPSQYQKTSSFIFISAQYPLYGCTI